MANEEHLKILNRGVEVWNTWRESGVDSVSEPDLSGARLQGRDLSDADLGTVYLDGADLRGAILNSASFMGAELKGADLTGAKLVAADLSMADLSDTNLTGANLSWASLAMTDLRGANLSDAELESAALIETDLRGANLVNCKVFGISTWGVKLDDAVQRGLVISPPGEPKVTVDNLEVAQFIYLLLNNSKIREVINTVTSKVVLILGRFTPERKGILDALREELRRRDFLPVIFDFDRPSDRNLTETVSTLAHMSRFVIADITDAKSIPQELQAIVPQLPSLPVQPLILSSQYEYAMFKDFMDYPWVLPAYRYDDLNGLLSSLEAKVLGPVTAKAKEIEQRRQAVEDKMKR